MHHVYVLQNTTGRFPIGPTADISLRLEQHNLGLSKWTAKYRPRNLVWQSQPLTLSEARKRENHLKHKKGAHGFFHATGLIKPGS